MKSIQLKYCRIDYQPGVSINTVFEDGPEWGSFPGTDAHYAVIAHRCGYQDDLWAYAFEHDFCHSYLSEKLGDKISWVLYGEAIKGKLHASEAAPEEALVQMFQAFLRANQRPIIGDVDWDGLKADALSLLDQA